jgi:hypothetical protein
MTKAPSPPADPFLSGPFEPDEVQRLLAVIDERLRLRAGSSPPVSAMGSPRPTGEAEPPPEVGLFDPMATVTGEGLRALAAPFFNRDRGGPLARSAKALLNLPLRLFGKPQAYFNDVLRTLISVWSDLLRGLLDGQAVLEHELAQQRRQLDDLAVRVDELRERLDRRSAGGPSPGEPA